MDFLLLRRGTFTEAPVVGRIKYILAAPNDLLEMPSTGEKFVTKEITDSGSAPTTVANLTAAVVNTSADSILGVAGGVPSRYAGDNLPAAGPQGGFYNDTTQKESSTLTAANLIATVQAGTENLPIHGWVGEAGTFELGRVGGGGLPSRLFMSLSLSTQFCTIDTPDSNMITISLNADAGTLYTAPLVAFCRGMYRTHLGAEGSTAKVILKGTFPTTNDLTYSISVLSPAHLYGDLMSGAPTTVGSNGVFTIIKIAGEPHSWRYGVRTSATAGSYGTVAISDYNAVTGSSDVEICVTYDTVSKLISAKVNGEVLYYGLAFDSTTRADGQDYPFTFVPYSRINTVNLSIWDLMTGWTSV